MNTCLKKLFLKTILFVLFNSYSMNLHSNIFHKKKFNHHLTQLEHISKAHSQCLTQLQKRLLEIEQEIDCLRGKIQENEYKLLNILEKQHYAIKQIDPSTNNRINITKQNNIITSSKIKCDNLSNTEDNRHLLFYNQAVQLVLEKKQYEKAIQVFQQFILKYPNSIYQANAHYWLGQLNYRLGNKNEASYYFALVVKNYPKSLKSSDALLKVGIIMEETGYKDKAKLIYKQVNHLYPNTDAAKQSQKRLHTFMN